MGQNNGLRPAVFLDRDGVLNENRSDYVKSWDEFVFLSGVFVPLRRLAQNHVAIVVITNQSAIGRGKKKKKTVEDIHARMVYEISRQGGRIDGIYYCPHHPDDGCKCRKPQPGLLFQAAAELHLDLEHSFLIGDAVSDIEAALAAGVQPIMVLTGRGLLHSRLLHQQGLDFVPLARDLAEAVDMIEYPQSVDDKMTHRT